MTADGERRRPTIAVFAAVVLFASVLAAPLFLGNLASDPALQSAYVRAASRDSYSLVTPVTLLESPRLVLERGTLSLAPGQSGKPRTGEALHSLLTGGGARLALDAATFTLDRADFPIRIGEGAGAQESTDILGPLMAALSGLNFHTLSVRNATILVRTSGADEEALRNVVAEITSKRNVSLSAKGTFRLRGQTLAFDTTIGTAGGKKEGPFPLRISIGGGLVAASVEGRLALGDRLQLSSQQAELKVPNLRELARWLGATWPFGRGLEAFSAKGPLEWSGGTIAFENASFMLDGNKASGGLSLSLGASHPVIEGTLAFNDLSLDPYLTARPAGAGGLAVATNWISLVPFRGAESSSLVREIDADIRISAASVAAGGASLGRCAATVSVKDGKLNAELAEVELDGGGKGEGQMSADMTAAEPRYSLRAKIKDYDMSRAARALFGHPAVEGVGTLAVDFTGEGQTEEAIVASLAGRMDIDLPEGARLGVDVGALTSVTETAPQDGWGPAVKGATALDSLAARFLATGGVLTVLSVTGSADATTFLAAGSVNVAERALDLTVSVTRGTPNDKDAAGDAAPAKGFQLRGPWASPTIRRLAPPGKSSEAPAPPGTVPPLDQDRG